MAITSGFFNSVNGDRTYNADQMSTYFKGLIGQGVFENVGGALQVLAGSGMTVSVQSGRAVLGESLKWIENDAVLNLTVNSAHVTLNRYTAVVIRLDTSTRDITITTKDGANATNPVKPAMSNTGGVYELCLAYIYVGAGVTAITQSNIQDTRANTSLCGWITGLVDQVDTETLFDQWTAAYNENIAEMESWETTQKAAFESWLSTLTSQLQVGAYIKQYEKDITLTENNSTTIVLDMNGYTYDTNDVIFVYINGLLGDETSNWTLNTNTTPVTVDLNLSPINEDIQIKVLKSVLGVPA